MHYMYVGYYVENNTFKEIQNRKINNMSVARQKFEYNIIRGLYERLGKNISFVSYVPTDGSLEIPTTSLLEGASIRHIAIQKKSARSVWYAYKIFKKILLNLGEDNLRDFCVLMYAVIPPFEQALIDLRKKYNFKLVTICSEIPELRRYGNSLSARLKKKILTYYNEQFDGYILFSDAMKEIVRMGSKPSIVMEGIAPDIICSPKGGKKNIVMYAGGLAADNNIPLLIECCLMVDCLSEIWICGTGSDEKRVIEMAAKDSRVKYFGLLSNEEVLKKETQAKVLVNFRNPKERLTRYSFPSKILEYIASGSVVMSTKLKGIPEEYFDYIIPIDVDNKDIIVSKLIQCLTMREEDYILRCVKAQDFIINNKSAKSQVEKIVKFITDL